LFAPASGLQGFALQLHSQAHLDIWLPAMEEGQQQQHRPYTARSIENFANYHWGTMVYSQPKHPQGPRHSYRKRWNRQTKSVLQTI